MITLGQSTGSDCNFPSAEQSDKTESSTELIVWTMRKFMAADIMNLLLAQKPHEISVLTRPFINKGVCFKF